MKNNKQNFEKIKSNKKKSKSALFTFRRYKKKEGGKTKRAKHPKLIVEETRNTFGFMGLTESAKRGKHNNIPLSTNPKKGDTRNAYIRKELRYDSKDNLKEELTNYSLTNEDKEKIKAFLNKKRK